MDRYEMFSKDPDLAMVMFSEELLRTTTLLKSSLFSIMHIHRNEVMGYITEGQSSCMIHADLNPLHIFRMIVDSMRVGESMEYEQTRV